MNYEEIKALESYLKQAQATHAAWLHEREEAERVATERRERERVEKLDMLKASLEEIVPPSVWPLVRFDDGADVHTGIWSTPFVYDDQELLKLVFYVNANMTVDFREINVPDARLCEYDGEWIAGMVYHNTALCIDTTEGSRYGAEHWEFAIVRAFEVLQAFREYQQRAAQHNAELAERRAEEQVIKQIFGKDAPAEDAVVAEVSPAFTVIEDEDIFRFERNVNAHLDSGWLLHGPMQVVAVPPDTRYEDLERFTLYVQALIRSEVA